MSASKVPTIATPQGQKDFLADTRAVASEVLARLRKTISVEVRREMQAQLRGNHVFHQFCANCEKMDTSDEVLESKRVGPFPSNLWMEMTTLLSQLHATVAQMDWSWLKSSVHDALVEIAQELQAKEDALVQRWLLDAGLDDYDDAKRPTSGWASARAPMVDQMVMVLVNTSMLIGSIMDSARGQVQLHTWRELWDILMLRSSADELAAIKVLLLGTTINSNKMAASGFFHNPHGHAVLKRLDRDKHEWYVREALIVLLFSATDRGHLTCRCRDVLTFIDAWVGVIVPDLPEALQERLNNGLRDAIEVDDGDGDSDQDQ